MLLTIISWLENHLLACPYKKYFGIECLGCGMQRSIIALLKGDVVESFYLYPALIPLLILFLFLPIHLFFKFKNGANILLYMFIFTIAMVVISYVIKISI